jgi:hypothetical protein
MRSSVSRRAVLAARWSSSSSPPQWDIFDRDGADDAGRRRLALWHARNAAIATHLYRGLASPGGTRTLLVIGAAHRPFLERMLQSQPRVRAVPAHELLAAR